MADAGADAIEVGIPFSDPVMDGPTIQETSANALARGATPASILTELKDVDAGVPLVAMTYYNLVYRPGEARFARWLAEAGVSGAIVPDIPLEESGPWCDAADAAGDRHRAARRADGIRRAARADLRAGPRVRLRRVAARHHRRAHVALGDGDRRSPSG